MNRLLFKTKFIGRGALLAFPRTYLRLSQARSKPNNSYLSTLESVRPDTDILISGLPRSGNSFATNAFRLAQDRPVRIAHHEYPPPQVAAAVRYGIPSLVIVRDPDDLAVSRVASHPPITLREALIDFVRCYGRLVQSSGEFVLATFEEVTTDFGLVIRRVNNRFATEFEEFDHTKENVQKAFDLIDKRYEGMSASVQAAFGQRVARPSSERDDMKRTLWTALQSEKLTGFRRRARDVYNSLLN
jgi:hypothetical protein